MIKEQTFHQKFEQLAPWIIEILNVVKKDLKNDHMRSDFKFVQKHFAKKTINKLTHEEITQAYLQEIKEGNEEIGEWIAQRWIFRNVEMYQFFAAQLETINPKIDEIESIQDEIGKQIADASIAKFGAINTYIFSVLNNVVFSEEIYKTLRQSAESAPPLRAIDENLLEESIENIQKKHEQEMEKICDKYEKKLLGFQRKYLQDVEGYKKQIKALQRKLHAENNG